MQSLGLCFYPHLKCLKRFIVRLPGAAVRIAEDLRMRAGLSPASVALGRSIGGHDVERGRVLYFAGENPTDVQMRWIAMAQQMNFDVNDIDVHFTCF